MNILIIHRFFPGQFSSLVKKLNASHQSQVLAVGQEGAINQVFSEKNTCKVYKCKKHLTTLNIHAYLGQLSLIHI